MVRRAPRRPPVVDLPTRSAMVAGGLTLDAMLGEPPSQLHPVAAFGWAMRKLEARSWRDSRAAGATHAAAGVALAVGTGALARRLVGGRVALVLATWVVVAGRSLRNEAAGVGGDLSCGRDELARSRLPALVGRDTCDLDAKEMARAAVESVAENTVDAVVAPLFWATVSGPAGALAYRAVNTLDALVGHRDERYLRFGWASARLDDLAGWVPARLTALLVCVVRPSSARSTVRAVRRDAPAHPSPNAGVAEAAFAGALGLTLGGRNTYGSLSEVRPTLGEGPPAQPDDVRGAVALSRDVERAAIATLISLTVLARFARRALFARGAPR